MVVPFSEYRAWLASPEYKRQIDTLVGQPNEPPRKDWPTDVSHLVRMHNELGNQHLRHAVEHFRKERDLLAPNYAVPQ
jgi:hypothetical protein